jgi:hypothetical protein
MPAKSRRDRRNISRNRHTNRPLKDVTAKIEANPATIADKSAASYYQKPVPNAAETNRLLLNEIKWIGIVTGVIVVLLFISYFIFR